MTILVTGAKGFIGTAVVRQLLVSGESVVAVVRRPVEPAALAGSAAVGSLRVTRKSLDQDTDWSDALAGVDRVVHLAARVHVLDDDAANSLEAFRAVNVEGTEKLARTAAAAGVKRLVLASTVKVHGEKTSDRPFTEADRPDPRDPYARSKWEAEQALQRVSEETGLEVAILRLPLVYGPEVKGNFRHLMDAVARGLPLPLASARNQRSLIYVGNVAAALTACLTHAAAAGHAFLVKDGPDVSSPELIRLLAAALERPARLLPCPPALVRWASAIVGRAAAAERLLESLIVDDSKIRKMLTWSPPYTLAEGLEHTARWYRAQRAASR